MRGGPGEAEIGGYKLQEKLVEHAIDWENIVDENKQEQLREALGSMSEDEYWHFVDSLSEDENIKSAKDKLGNKTIHLLLERGFQFSEIHLGEKFGVQDFIDIDDLKLVRLANAVLTHGESLPQDEMLSINDKAFIETMVLAPKHKGVVDRFIGLLGQHHTIRPDIFVREIAKASANPEIDHYQKTALVDSFEYIYSSGGGRYDEALVQGLVFNNPEKAKETGYFLNLLSSAHGLSKYGPSSAQGVSKRIEEALENALAKPEGSYFLRLRARDVLENIKNESYQKPYDWKPFEISPGKQAVFTEKGLCIISADKKETRITRAENLLSTKELSALDVADFEFFEQSYMRELFEKEFGISINEMQLPEQFQFLSFLKSKDEEEVNKLKIFTKKFGVTGMRTFLSLEYGKEFGDRIIDIGLQLEESEAKSIFDQYARIVDSVNSVTSFLKNEEVTTPHIKNIKERLLRSGRLLLEDVAKNLEKSVQYNKDEVSNLLKKYEADNLLFFHSARALRDSGEKLNIFDLEGASFEVQSGGALSEEEKREMIQMYEANYGEQSGFSTSAQHKLLSGFEKAVSQPFSTFYTYKLGGKLKAFCRIDDRDDFYYFGSFNTDNNLQGVGLGEGLMRATIDEKRKEKEVKMDCSALLPIGAHYIERGFRAVGYYDFEGMPSLALTSAGSESCLYKGDASTQTIVSAVTEGHPILNAEVRTGVTQKEIDFSPLQNGYFISRYFFSKDTNCWIVLFEKSKEEAKLAA